MEATIFDTSPKDAFGFWPLMAAWVSRKKRAYAETGFCGSLGSFFGRPILVTVADGVGGPEALLEVVRETEDWTAGWERTEGEDRDMGESTSTLRCDKDTLESVI